MCVVPVAAGDLTLVDASEGRQRPGPHSPYRALVVDGPTLSRRRFLARVGVLGAGAMVLGALPVRGAGAVDRVRLADAAIDVMERDTFRGLVVWVVPGEDPYSRAQGEHSPGGGALDARTDVFLRDALNKYVPFPDELLRPLAIALTRAGHRHAAAASMPAASPEWAGALDEALGRALHSDRTMQATMFVTLLLNHLATQVRPDAVQGPFPGSPFANLTHDQKCEAWRVLEADSVELVGMVDSDLDEPARRSLAGLLQLLGVALPTFTAFGTYSEFGVFDRSRREATQRPVGWDLANFAPGRRTPADGWDEFKGYHRGIR